MPRKIGNGLDLLNQAIINLSDPSGAQDAATKNYVDSVIRGLDWKPSVRAASTGNINLSSPGTTIDGVTLANGDRFLAKNQTTGSQNGIYVFNGSASVATRATDADVSAEVTSGMALTVTEGTANENTTWVLTTDDPIVLATTALVFTALGGSTPYVAGNGLTLSGTTFNIGAGTGMTINADDIAIDISIVSRKITANVGNGAATAITITHNLGTRDVSVDVYLNSSPWDEIDADITRPDANNVTITFATAPATSAYRVVIQG